MTILLNCYECYQDFPDHLINSMVISNCSDIENGSYLMCPLCALKIRNSIHELPEDTPFRGTIANKKWEEATEYARKNH